MEWQPIETVPRDRTPVLVWLGDDHLGARCAVAVLTKTSGVVGGVFVWYAPKLLAWMPLPPPPERGDG